MKTILLLFFIIQFSLLHAQTRFLVPYREGDLWGYADTNLNIVVAPQFNDASTFGTGHATIIKNKLIGLINSKGKVVIPPQYEMFTLLSGKRYLVAKGGMKGIIEHPTGRVLLPISYRDIYGIGNDAFIVTTKNNLKGVYHLEKRKWLLPPGFKDILFGYPWHQAYTKDSVIYFKILQNGKLVKGRLEQEKPQQNDEPFIDDIPPQVEMLNEDAPQFGIFRYGDKYGFYTADNNNGKQVVDSANAVYDYIERMATRDALIVRKGGKTGIIGLQKQVLVPLIYQALYQAAPLNLPGVLVATVAGKKGIINSGNDVIIPLIYDEVYAVDSTAIHQVYIVKKNGKFGLARRDKQLVPCEYDTIGSYSSFKDGFILSKNEKTGAFLYSNEKAIFDVFIPAAYDYLLGLLALYDYNFNVTIPPRFNYKNALFLLYASKGGKKGFIGINGKEYFKH